MIKTMNKAILAVYLTPFLLSCTKSTTPPDEQQKQPYFVRVAAPDGASITYSNVAIVKNTNGNGGQANEDSFGKLVYAGYESGYYVLELTNKQGCGIDFDVKWLKKDTTIYVPANGTKVIQLPGTAKGNEKIKARPLYRCGTSGGNMGWIEVETPSSLPVTFKSIRCVSVEKQKIHVEFEIADLKGVSVFYIETSTDGINWKTSGLVFVDEVKPGNKYSITVSL